MMVVCVRIVPSLLQSSWASQPSLFTVLPASSDELGGIPAVSTYDMAHYYNS